MLLSMTPIKKYDDRSGIETTIFRRSDGYHQLSVVDTDENRLVETCFAPLSDLKERANFVHRELRSK